MKKMLRKPRKIPKNLSRTSLIKRLRSRRNLMLKNLLKKNNLKKKPSKRKNKNEIMIMY